MDQYSALSAGVTHIIPEDDFKKKLASGKKLRIKLGADPTAPDLHLGHAVALSKLRQFQDFGHEVIFLIGDFTARIGDPSGRSKTRPPLSDEDIKRNTQTYFAQVSKILDPQKVTIRYNSEWLGALSAKDFVGLCSKTTVARIIEREDFAQRMAQHQTIGFHELLYPLLQGYDSVALEADVELGGSDQTFNLLMGRFLQEQWGQSPQAIMTLPLLEGLDGVQKMSKSYGNSIGLSEPSDQAYGKLLSLSDDLMWRYYEVLLHTSSTDILRMKEEVGNGSAHPLALKKAMAHKIVERFWSAQEAQQAQQQFEELFQKKDYSQVQKVDCQPLLGKEVWVVDILKYLGATSSTSDARRLIEAGAVSVNEEKITDFARQITVHSDMLFKVGKHRFYKIA